MASELEQLQHDMNTTLYPKHHTVMDRLGPNSLIYAVFDADQLFIRIDASFSESKLDKHHDLRTIISVHTQDKINKFCPLLSTAEQSVFKPFLTSRERAALSNPKSGLRELQISLPVLIVCSHTSALSPLLQPLLLPASGPFSASGLHCSQLPLGAVNLTAALDLIATTARIQHIFNSFNNAIATVIALQRELETGLWVNARIVTAEQWVAQEKEMIVWTLKYFHERRNSIMKTKPKPESHSKAPEPPGRPSILRKRIRLQASAHSQLRDPQERRRTQRPNTKLYNRPGSPRRVRQGPPSVAIVQEEPSHQAGSRKPSSKTCGSSTHRPQPHRTRTSAPAQQPTFNPLTGGSNSYHGSSSRL
ncbi:MAG: hypothetical protein FRX48_08899 [Lasallia pustulata]|uniref:Uncharacterized protein n=1 Tax=Lasallia pustulata TaxID=136370 RepID=A0A5M8PDI1_9LECA|nr:MAG: hypothetical protein FRX48_08899 [Lasallia pustulata]